MHYLFDLWESFTAAVKASTYILLLSDYDGTLTPIVSRPEDAILPSSTKDELNKLAEQPSFKIGIISGRPLSEVKTMVGIKEIYYAGNHGLEIEGPDLKFINPLAQKARTELKEIVQQLRNKLNNIKGIIIEDKGLSLSVHYRMVKEDEEKLIAEIYHQVTSPWLQEGKIRITSGKKVFEIRPPIDWHKGKAVEAIIKELKIDTNSEQWLTLYLGDDTTDEDAFKVIHQPRGWSIFVGQKNNQSNAEYFLNSASEVSDFLSRLSGLK